MLEKFFNPRNVAVIGVSENQNKIGSVIYLNIKRSGFEGKVFAVNPKYDSLFGDNCYKSLSAINSPLDLAIISIPPEGVLEVVKEAAKKNVANLIIITAGFKEIGKDGEATQREIINLAKNNNIRILGPNCLGAIMTKSKLNASFAATHPVYGNIAFLSQSGAFNTAILDMASENNLGFSHFISLGNKADINEYDLVKEFLKNDEVKVIGGYLEQFEDGKDFIDLLKTGERKPVVLLHSGETESGRIAAGSHTGSLSSPAKIIRSALSQAGVIQVDTIEELFADLMMFSWVKNLPKTGRTAIITNAGGPAIMLTDMLHTTELELVKPSDESVKSLMNVLPFNASLHNPFDLVGDASAQRYNDSLEILSASGDYDILIALLTPQYVTQIEETAKAIINITKKSGKLIVPIFIGGETIKSGLKLLWNEKIPAFRYPEEAVHSLNSLVKYSKFIRDNKKRLITKIDTKSKHKPKFKNEVEKYLTEKPVPLPEDLAKNIALEVGLDIPKEEVVESFEECLGFVKKTGFPIVLKATSQDVVHKTDLKAIYLNINNEANLKKSFDSLRHDLQKLTKKTKVKVLIQEQVAGNLELFFGAQRDGDKAVYEKQGKGFGHLLLFGHGGIYTEILNDISYKLTPLGLKDMLEIINKTKVSKIIHGARGKKPLAFHQAYKTIEGLQKMVSLYPEIESIDINPALLNHSKCICVDVKIFVKN